MHGIGGGAVVACPRSRCLAFTPPSFVTDLLQPELC